MRTLALAYPNALVGTFYRRAHWGQQIPTQGGLVLYTNHVNGLMDADMPLFLTSRQQYFLAKPSLFRMPGISWVIRTVGAIPIYRQKDKADMSKNDESFREIYRVLQGGGAISLYPEGESRLGFRTRPFKTGAARMALGAQRQDMPPIQLLPVSLLYEEQETFLSRVHLWVGEPFDLLPWMADYEERPREVVRQVTSELQARLEDLCIPVDDRQTFQALLNADRILSVDANGTAPRIQALAKHWAIYSTEHPLAAENLAARLLGFGEAVESLGLEARDLLGERLHRPPIRWLMTLASILFGLLMLPILGPPVALATMVARIGRSTPDKLVTVTTIATSVLVPIWGIVLAYVSTTMDCPLPGFWGVLGLFWALAYVARRASLAWRKPRALRRTLTGLGLLGRKQTICDLWNRKQELQTELRSLFPGI